MVSGKSYPERDVVAVHVNKVNWKEFVKICRREGKSGSDILDEFINQYVQRHRSGNPQLLISSYLDFDEPQPIRVLCSYCNGALNNGDVYCQKNGMWIKGIRCYSCKHNRLRQRKNEVENYYKKQ